MKFTCHLMHIDLSFYTIFVPRIWFQMSAPGFRTDKLENGLLKLVESLERKRDRGDWIDHLVVKESNAAYGDD